MTFGLKRRGVSSLKARTIEAMIIASAAVGVPVIKADSTGWAGENTIPNEAAKMLNTPINKNSETDALLFLMNS